MSFLKQAASEAVSLRQLRDWLVEANKTEFLPLCKLATAEELTEHEPVVKLLYQLMQRYMGNVKQAGVSPESDFIASQILKLSDDASIDELNRFWEKLDQERRWFLVMGLPESIYRFQKRGSDLDYLAISTMLKCSGFDDLADLIIDDYPIIDRLDDVLNKVLEKVTQ